MYYIGPLYTIFALHCEDANLANLPYIHFDRAMVWYAMSPETIIFFERFREVRIFTTAYLTEFNSEARLA